jgi:aspartyl-tRNA(Asn)/glutamyl-tRNA(Gln) amidotransferase subunit A
VSDIETLARQLAAGETTSRDLVEQAIARAQAAAPVLNATISIVTDAARRSASADATDGEDASRASADATSAARTRVLAGIPYAHKDIFCTSGVRTTAGSRMLAGFVPPYDATVHEELVAAGAVMVAKANMDEFAMGSSNDSALRAIPGISDVYPAARRGVRRRWSQRAWCHLRPVPTLAGRCGSRPHFAA